MTRENNRRSRFSGGEETLHKYAGINSSQIDNNDFYYNKDEDNFHPCQNGQHGSPSLSNENGRHKKPGISHDYQRLPLAPRDQNYYQVSNRGVDCRTRQRIQDLQDSRE